MPNRTRPLYATAAITAVLAGAIERITSDADGKRLSINVKVSRQGADVRARSHVTINPKR